MHRTTHLVGLALALSQALPQVQASEPAAPQIFEPGRISTEAVEVGLAFETDGRTLYFTRYPGRWGAELGRGTIHRSRRDAAGWSPSQPAPFSGRYDDGEVSISPDGERLLFTSIRPDARGARTDADIFMMSRSAAGEWGEPERLPPPVNSPAREMSPVMTSTGRLYFASDRPGGTGQADIYVSELAGARFTAPANLGPAINGEGGEWNLLVDPHERLLIFEASGRTGNLSPAGDLWISQRRAHHWSQAIPLSTVNTEGSDLAPALSQDARTLYYTSTRRRGALDADILQIDLQALLARHPPAVATSRQPLLAAVSRGEHFLALIDPERGEVRARIPTGRGPHEVAVAPDGRRAYVANYGIYPVAGAADSPGMRFVSEPGGTITVANLARGTVEQTWTLQDCSRPHGIAISRDGLRVWATCEDSRSIVELEASSGRLLARYRTGRPGSHMVARADEDRLLAVSNVDDGSVSLIDRYDSSARRVPTGAAAEGSALDHERGELWVLNAGANTVSIVDVEGATAVASFDSGGVFPIRVQFDPARGEAWIANNVSRSLTVFDVRSRRLLATLAIGDIVLGLLIPAESRYGFVTLPRQGQVAVIDLAQRRLVRRVDVGLEVDGLAWVAGD